MADTPKIRFKGFMDDWEQRKLIDVCDYVDYRGKTPTKTEIGIFLVTAKNVKDGYIDYESSKEYISEDDYEEVMRRGKPEIGDVLITTEAPCGNVAQVNKGNIALAQRIIKYRGHSNMIDNTYLKYYLLSPEFQKILDAKSSGGTVRGIKGSVLHQQIIQYPLYEEQVKIGLYFDNLDHLIILHLRKCEEVKKLKKYMLQKMFPQNGKKIPEIRFVGFTDEWEQRKLDEMVTEVNRTDENSDAPVMMITANEGFINQSERYSNNNAGQSLKKYIVLEKGELAYNHGASKLRPYGSCFVLTTAEKARVPFVYHCFATKTENAEFLSIVLNGKSVERQLKRIVSSSVRMDGLLNISFEEYTSIPVVLPSVAEQNKIATYFRHLDYLITLHQRKCDELKEVKKFMLEKMFV